MYLEKIFNDILPPGVFTTVPGDSFVGKQLVAHPLIRMISFTGSTAAGMQISQQCGLKKSTLELGGKNAAIICESADIESTAHAVMWGAFANAGQNCCAISRVLVHKSVIYEFVQALKCCMSRLRLGDAMDPNTDIGRVIDETSFQRMIDDMQEFKLYSKLECGGGANGENMIVPALFTGVSDSSRLATDELFGPILAILEP